MNRTRQQVRSSQFPAQVGSSDQTRRLPTSHVVVSHPAEAPFTRLSVLPDDSNGWRTPQPRGSSARFVWVALLASGIAALAWFVHNTVGDSGTPSVVSSTQEVAVEPSTGRATPTTSIPAPAARRIPTPPAAPSTKGQPAVTVTQAVAKPAENDHAELVQECIGRLRAALEADEPAAAREAVERLRAVPDKSLAKPVLDAWSLQQKIEAALRATLGGRSHDPAQFQQTRKLIATAPAGYPFSERVSGLCNRVREHLGEMMRGASRSDLERCTALLSEAEAWGVGESARRNFAVSVIKEIRSQLPHAIAPFRKPGFADFNADRRQKAEERLNELIEAGEILVAYEPELQKLLDSAKEAPHRNAPERPAVPLGRRGRGPSTAPRKSDDPASSLYIECRPLIYNQNQYRGDHYLSGVRGTVTNMGARPIKNITLRVLIRFPGFQEQYVVSVGVSLEPGQTHTWQMRDVGEQLPNPRELQIQAAVYNAQFGD